MTRNLQNILDGDVPDDVSHWIVEFHWEFDDRNSTPLQAVQEAVKHITQNHGWMVTHIRSGLTWSVDLGRSEVIEIEVGKK